MKIDYEAYDVYDPDYLNEHLGFVAGVLELLVDRDHEAGEYFNSHIQWVLHEARDRTDDILTKLHESVIAARDIEKKAIQGTEKKAK